MNGRLRRLATNLHSEGFSWLRKRLAAEKAFPTTRIGRGIHLLARRGLRAAAAAPRALNRIIATEFPGSRNVLFAFYDLQVAPVTFDFLWFLAASELHRRRSGLKSVHVVIVPGPHDGVRQEHDGYEKVVDSSGRQARIHNMLIPACRLLPSCSGVTLAGSRAEASFLRSAVAHHVAPKDYELSLPVFPGPQACLEAARAGDADVACLRAAPEDLRIVTAWARRNCGGRRIVSITLRRYGYMPARNSSVPAWIAFARGLDSSRYSPVFVPDTNDTVEGLPATLREFTVFPEAAWNIGLRMALYEHAFLNLGVNSGPMGLAWLNARVRYAMLKIEIPHVPQSSLEFIQSFGYEPGKSLPFATPLQEWLWEDDTEENIVRAFQRLTQKIEAAEVDVQARDRFRNGQTRVEILPA
jgi:hypothetical protein